MAQYEVTIYAQLSAKVVITVHDQLPEEQHEERAMEAAEKMALMGKLKFLPDPITPFYFDYDELENRSVRRIQND